MRFLRSMSVVAAALASSGCLTLYGGFRQPIIVSSSPAGAQVLLDGQPVGAAPVEVAVERGSEPTFLVESDAFEPTALRLRRRVNPWIAVDLAVGALAFYATGAALIGGSEGGTVVERVLRLVARVPSIARGCDQKCAQLFLTVGGAG